MGSYVQKLLRCCGGALGALIAGMLLVLSFCTQAAELDCGKMLDRTAAKKYGKHDIERAQRQLAVFGFDPEWMDGILGWRTKAALKGFCEGAEFALSDDLLAMLRNHAAIHRAYPDWVHTLASHDFMKWMEKQPDAAEIRKIRAAGSSSKVIWVLDRYRRYKSFVPAARSVDDLLFSYSLNEGDFKMLASADEVLKRIGKLHGKAYPSMDDFEAALDDVMKGVAEPDRYKQVVLSYAETQDGFMLNDVSFQQLKVNNVPDYIQQALQPLKDLNYPGDGLKNAAETILDQLAAKIMKFKPQIISQAEISPSGAKFTEGAIGKFAALQEKDDPLAAVIVDRLQGMKNVMYTNDKAIEAAVGNILGQEVERVQGALPEIVDAADEIAAYGLGNGAMPKIKDDLNKLLVPQIYLEMLAELQDADYPESDLLWSAARAKVSMAGSNNILKRIIFGVIDKHAADTLDDTLLGEMKDHKVPPAVLAELEKLKGIRFEDSKALESRIEKNFGQLSEQLEPYKSLILAQARKKHEFDKSKNIQLEGTACNCVHDNLEGEVYGFYPYWLAGKKQDIDFSVLTRLEYFALGFDDQGNLPSASRWSGLDTEFISVARKYRSKVDLVIYRNDWKTWSELDAAGKSQAFGKLAANIASLLDMPLTDFASRAKPYVSLGMGRRPVRGNGVTLYFDGYPDDGESVEAFVEFVGTLNRKLGSGTHGHFVNIMFRSRDIGKGVYEYGRLLDFMGAMKGRGDHEAGNFVVLLEEPSTMDKKKLRANVEDGLHGKNRMKLLRNMVMVISYDGRSERQLADDVIYAGDNFGGIGFWPQPVAEGDAGAAATGAISQALHNNFLKELNGLASTQPNVCKYVCPNRWFFRLAWDSLLLLLLASAVLYATACSWRPLFDAHFIRFIVFVVLPFFLLTLALLFCDPSWKSFAGDYSLPIMMAVVMIGYVVWNYREKKRKANLP